MKAYQLLAKLRLLTLSADENGKIEWIGKGTDFDKLELEEESIIRDFELAKI